MTTQVIGVFGTSPDMRMIANAIGSTQNQRTHDVSVEYRDDEFLLVSRYYYEYLCGNRWALYAIGLNDGVYVATHIISAAFGDGESASTLIKSFVRNGDVLLVLLRSGMVCHREELHLQNAGGQ